MKYNDHMPKMKVDPETYVRIASYPSPESLMQIANRLGRRSRRCSLRGRPGNRTAPSTDVLCILGIGVLWRRPKACRFWEHAFVFGMIAVTRDEFFWGEARGGQKNLIIAEVPFAEIPTKRYLGNDQVFLSTAWEVIASSMGCKYYRCDSCWFMQIQSKIEFW